MQVYSYHHKHTVYRLEAFLRHTTYSETCILKIYFFKERNYESRYLHNFPANKVAIYFDVYDKYLCPGISMCIGTSEINVANHVSKPILI